MRRPTFSLDTHRMWQVAMSIACLVVLGILVTESAAANGKACSTTTLTASPNPSAFGQAITFTATVAYATCPSSPSQSKAIVPYPTGTVTFYDGGTAIGTGTVSSPATFTTSSLSSGSHSVTAVYGGDSNYNGSTSNLVLQQVGDPSPREVPEADTLLLLGGGIGGLAAWLRFQWTRRRRIL